MGETKNDYDCRLMGNVDCRNIWRVCPVLMRGYVFRECSGYIIDNNFLDDNFLRQLGISTDQSFSEVFLQLAGLHHPQCNSVTLPKLFLIIFQPSSSIVIPASSRSSHSTSPVSLILQPIEKEQST